MCIDYTIPMEVIRNILPSLKDLEMNQRSLNVCMFVAVCICVCMHTLYVCIAYNYCSSSICYIIYVMYYSRLVYIPLLTGRVNLF